MSRKDTIKIRQDKVKEAFLEQLKRTPTIETSCQKVSVSRTTVYRWIKASKRFEKKVDEALIEGRAFMSDVAETQLFSLIGDKEMSAIRLYLSTHNSRYSNKVELSGTVSTKDEPLTAEQKKLIRQALRLSSLRNYGKKNGEGK
ncbi:MAG: phBC6A51 family helix-turn-helix protein [bacterium]